jgi:hypothetical protein
MKFADAAFGVFIIVIFAVTVTGIDLADTNKVEQSKIDTCNRGN